METAWMISGTIVIALLLRYLLKPKYKLPPGPKGWPLVGNALQVDITCPHKTLTEWSEKYGDVYAISVSKCVHAIHHPIKTVRTLSERCLGSKQYRA